MQALHTLLESSDMLTSMAIMTPRLKGLRRMLGSTGSPYLRRDSTASHYLKLLMDAVFGPADSWSRQPVEIGIDGEAMVLESPIGFRTLLGALRVRIPSSGSRMLAPQSPIPYAVCVAQLSIGPVG
jgi:hypothetical protein